MIPCARASWRQLLSTRRRRCHPSQRGDSDGVQGLVSRLFIAVDLTKAALAKLVQVELPRGERVRIVTPDLMHLTLHFLGDADAERTAEALQEVAVPKFSLTIAGVGHFSGRDGSVILWAGVRSSPELTDLHATVATAISKIGFQPEVRPFTPHITLARCQRGLSDEELTKFETQYSHFAIPDIPITKFVLYSSTPDRHGPIYHRERSFPLFDR